jgi:flavin-dependent dehydrogenase
MRVGGVSKCSDVQSQFLAIGDAAGHCDPLSGLGLYPGMLAAKAASDTIVEALLSETHSIAHFQVAEEKRKKWLLLKQCCQDPNQPPSSRRVRPFFNYCSTHQVTREKGQKHFFASQREKSDQTLSVSD